MGKLCLFFVLAIISSSVLGSSFRNKHHADNEEEFDDDDDFDDEDDSDDDSEEYSEEDSDDINGLKRPSRPNRPGGGRPLRENSSQSPDQLPSQIPDQFPRQQTSPPAPTTVPTPNVNGATTQSSITQVCIRTCPVTSEYNPVCGSNGVTYDNPGRLLCAKACGVTVNLLRSSRCTSTTVAPTS